MMIQGQTSCPVRVWFSERPVGGAVDRPFESLPLSSQIVPVKGQGKLKKKAFIKAPGVTVGLIQDLTH